MSKTLYILRGLPGSGKSTYTKENLKDAIVCSADDYFTRPDGFYDWNPKLLKNAHDWCFMKASSSMNAEIEKVVIDNTNIKKSQYKKYTEEAKKFGYEIREVMVGSLDKNHCEQYASRNVHKVPLQTILKMAKDFEQ